MLHPHQDGTTEAWDRPLPALADMNVSRETFERLRCYADLLLRWTKTISLVSKQDEALVWDRHVPDSIRLAPLLPPGLARAVDLGSGGGLPALPLAIMSGVAFDLIESDRRKAAFLREAGRVTGAPVTVHCERIEQSGVAPAPLVTARALAPLPKLLGYAKRFLLDGGTCLFPKGASAPAELAGARAEWRFSCQCHAMPPDPHSVVLAVRDLQHV